MTLVMDGVRRVASTRPVSGSERPEVEARPQPVELARPAQPVQRLGVGLDGVRRPTPRPAVVEAEAPQPQRRAARLHFDSWRRPALTIGMTIVALVVSGITVRMLSTPRTNAAHAEAAAVIPSPTPAPATPTPALEVEQGKLQQLLNAFVTAHGSGTFDIVVKDLSTGAMATANPDRSYESASLYKLFVADQIYHLIDTGGLKYDAAAGGGSGNTIRGCLSLMITISDNTCGRALGSILNWGAQNPALSAQGFIETDLTTPQATSARDVATLFEKLYNGTLASPASNAAFLTLLKNQKVNDRLPQGLPAGTVIAHKTGNLDQVVHDGGIVYGPKTNYVVVVMSGPWTLPGAAPAQFAELSRELWQTFEQ